MLHMLLHQVTHDPLPAHPPGVQGIPGSPYNLTAEDTHLVITELTPNSNYSITVCAFTSVGCGPLSIRVNQTDEDGKTTLKFAFRNTYTFRTGMYDFMHCNGRSHLHIGMLLPPSSKL